METTDTSPGDKGPPGQPDAYKLREERLLDAATTLLVRWGYRKTSLDDVAREAGVGKGTIYLHWKDKQDLFRAAIWRANRQASEDLKQRIAADPEGGLPHRLWTHSMLAALTNPLVAAQLRGQADIFQGLIGAFDPKARQQLVGNAETYVAQLQQAGLIRADLSVSVITYLMAVLKMGVITAPELVGQDHLPAMEQLAQTLSDLIRRWLSPEQTPADTTAGKQALGVWLDNYMNGGTT
ncbi:MAG TPA: TetR/AcrR family transcriptional regulator [Ktedonobacteraceae bacterium]|nr:TetR/AcrR family transcriptional regulator [Ktedonobacteraceae bacterium]